MAQNHDSPFEQVRAEVARAQRELSRQVREVLGGEGVTSGQGVEVAAAIEALERAERAHDQLTQQILGDDNER